MGIDLSAKSNDKYLTVFLVLVERPHHDLILEGKLDLFVRSCC
jgi:hypothetical protein